MIPKESPQKRGQRILKSAVAETMKKAGFTKRGVVHLREIGSVLHVLNSEGDGYNTADKVSFTLNCGVHVKGVMDTFGTGDAPRLSASACLIHVRPGFLTPGGNQWWELRSADAPETDLGFAQEIQSLIERVVLPFFDRFPTEREVADFLSSTRVQADRFIDPRCESLCYAYGGIIWSQLGEHEKCRAAMTQAATLAKGKRLEADVELFAKNFVCDGNPKVGTPQT